MFYICRSFLSAVLRKARPILFFFFHEFRFSYLVSHQTLKATLWQQSTLIKQEHDEVKNGGKKERVSDMISSY